MTDNQPITYQEPSPLKISTYTVVCNITKPPVKTSNVVTPAGKTTLAETLPQAQPQQQQQQNDKIDLYILSRLLPIYKESNPECDTKQGCFLMISKYTESGSTDMPRGDVGNKWPSNVFNNQITLKYRYWNKNINLKIFSNGKLQMTGIKDPETEPRHMGQAIIDRLKTLKYRIYNGRKSLNMATTTGQIRTDYALVYQPNTPLFNRGSGEDLTPNPQTHTNIDWMRRNLDVYDIRQIMEKGMVYDYDATRWYSSTEVSLLIRDYCSFADKKVAELEALRDVLLNQYEYAVPERMSYHKLLSQYRQLIKIGDRNMLNMSDVDYKKTITKLVEKITKIFKSYKITMTKLFEYDCIFRDDVVTKYSQAFIDELARSKDAGAQLTLQDFPTKLMTREYHVENIATELINSDYNTRMNNNLPEIYRILSNKYKLYCKYEPNEKYAGIIVKFKYNPNYLDETRYKPGRCYCPGSCSNKKTPVCTKLTVSIFRPGSIIITAAKNLEQLMFVYNYINRILKDNYQQVFYRDISGMQRDHYRANEDRKIVRKDNIIYVRASDIVYPDGRGPINLVSSEPIAATTATESVAI